MARIGIFGGTFDPVHYGHLILAERCREQAGLDRIIFLPARQSPLKENQPHISDSDRIALLNLAISGHDCFEVDPLEIQGPEKSFTVETLAHFARERKDDQLFLLLGSDSVADFADWRSPEKICQLATLLLVNRPGLPQPDWDQLKSVLSEKQIDLIRQNQVRSPLIEISATEIRSRIAEGKSIRFLLPRGCEKYIETHKLYQTKI